MLAALWFLYLAARHSALPTDATDEQRARDLASAAAPARRLLLLIGSHRPDRARARGGARPRRARRRLRARCAFLFMPASRPLRGRACLRRRARRRVPLHRAGGAGGAGRRRAARASRLRRMAHARAPRFLGAAAARVRADRGLLAAGALRCARPSWRRPGGRRATQPRGDFGDNLRYYLATASWFAWPAWPLAAWSAWTLRARMAHAARIRAARRARCSRCPRSPGSGRSRTST